jgi:hypothetical protein
VVVPVLQLNIMQLVLVEPEVIENLQVQVLVVIQYLQ